MSFDHILATALKGAGMRGKLDTKSRFCELVAEQEALPKRYPAGTKLGRVLRAQPFHFSAAMASEGPARAIARRHPDYEFDARRRAEILFLGESIIECAAKKLPPGVHELARLWKKAGWQEQEMILDRLALMLRACCDGSAESIYVDRLEQASGRVLPAVYQIRPEQSDAKRKKKKRGGRARERQPNCLGKAQAIAGFAHLAGARMCALCPAEPENLAADKLFGELAALALSVMKTKPCARDEKLEKVLADMIERGEEAEKAPSFLHGAIAVQLRNRRWVIVDPNMRLLRLDRGKRLARAVERVERFSKVQPGFVAYARHKRPEQILASRVAKFKKLCANLKTWLERVRSGDPNHLTRLLDKWGGLILGRVLRLPHRQNFAWSAAEKVNTTVVRLVTRRLISDRYKNERPDKLVLTALSEFPPMLLAEGLHVVQTRWDQWCARTAHPTVQVQEVRFFLGASTLAHVAFNEGDWKTVEQELAKHSAEQFRQYHWLLALLQQPRAKIRAELQELADQFEKLPGRLVSVDAMLKKLRAQRTIS